MRTHVHKAAVGVAAAAFLAAPILAAAPASAMTSITPATCAAEQGTFTRVKGVKTCTVVAGGIRHVSPTQFHSNEVFGPFTNEFLTGASYYGEWYQHEGYRDTTVYTQKAKRPIDAATTSELVSMSIYDLTCVTGFGGGSYGFAYTFQCDIAGVYPAPIQLPS